MHPTFFSLQRRLTGRLRRGDLAGAEKEIVARMRKIPKSPFHVVLKSSISNETGEAGARFDRLFRAAGKKFKVAAAWTEMNAFDVNARRWPFDLFATSVNDYDDKSDQSIPWETLDAPRCTIRGLEELQKAYARKAFREGEYEEASAVCSLLVVVKFQRFIQEATGLMEELRFPLYVTGHGFDFIAVLHGASGGGAKKERGKRGRDGRG